MNVTSIRPQTVAERHVQFSEYVDVRYITPMATPSASATGIQPSLYAQRLEQALRSQPDVVVQPQPQPAQSNPTRIYKNVMHTAAMVFGTLIIPSFACLVIGPLGLIAPAVLASLSLTCALLGGRPTETMERERAIRAVEVSEYDPR